VPQKLKIDHSPAQKLRAAKRVWRSSHPACCLSRGRITRGSLSFGSTRTLGAGVEVTWWVTAWKVDDKSCSLQVRMQLYDERVNALRAIAMGSDSSTGFLDFDVPAASSLMDGQEMPHHQLFDSNASAEEFARVVADYSKRIDRIWRFVGGPSVPGVERLAIWALRNCDAGTIWHISYGGVCAAFTYGESELAHELIAEFMSQWEERVREEPRDIIFETYHRVRQDLERLQEAVRRPNRYM
jgi:hypothetical protein